MTQNLYKTLGVEQSATRGEIKKAYRVLAAKYHPDKDGGDKTAFQELENAYSILINRAGRDNYDKTRMGEDPDQIIPDSVWFG